jgi:DNA gyrase inhibitor GyrI
MRKKKMAIALIIVGLIALGLLWGALVSHVENAKYTVITAEENIEIRDYPPLIVAEVTTQGPRQEAIKQGFTQLADYIFGNNSSKNKISMTAPVTQQDGEKISMTAPVTQQGNENAWTIRFIMPSNYTLDTLPRPNNDKVRIHQIPSARFAVIKFSGTAKTDTISSHENKLKTHIDHKNLKQLSAPTYAFFNPPWTLPPLRRNEIMIEIQN